MSAMGYYHFTIDKSGGIEVLGGTPLDDDAAAIAFSQQVIRDLKHDAKECAGWAMLITEGARTVGAIPFELDAGRRTGSALTEKGYEVSR
jgi:hypothetical protein